MKYCNEHPTAYEIVRVREASDCANVLQVIAQDVLDTCCLDLIPSLLIVDVAEIQREPVHLPSIWDIMVLQSVSFDTFFLCNSNYSLLKNCRDFS
jgi:hypothetical protein